VYRERQECVFGLHLPGSVHTLAGPQGDQRPIRLEPIVAEIGRKNVVADTAEFDDVLVECRRGVVCRGGRDQEWYQRRVKRRDVGPDLRFESVLLWTSRLD
jgi:hypothetical protein